MSADESMNIVIHAECPWCRSRRSALINEPTCDRRVVGVDENNGPIYYVECEQCGARGPIADWAIDAVNLWDLGVASKVKAPGQGVDEKTEGSRERLAKILTSATVEFGLSAQGLIPKIKEMLARGEGWGDIGAAIGWDPETAREHYYRELLP
jgi:hypothetical protein